MTPDDKVNILLVDDQPAKLATYEVILRELGDNLIKVESGKQALEQLLKSEIAVILMDVSMPELDGFELASMIREHPRFQRIAMIFISAIHLAEMDHLRGYQMGAVDYVPVPVVPEVLRAKVRIFADLYRNARALERLNAELEHRVAERTAELEASTRRLIESEQLRSLALAAGSMGTWDWDLANGTLTWDEGQHSIFGVVPGQFAVTPESAEALVVPEDRENFRAGLRTLLDDGRPFRAEFCVRRPNGELRWCTTSAVASRHGGKVRITGVTRDVTERRLAEEQQALLAREVDHRARNAMSIVQSIVRLTKAGGVAEYLESIEGRIMALSRAHTVLSDARWQGADLGTLVDEELAPYRPSANVHVSGPKVLLEPAGAQAFALALHELATNAAKYGALSSPSGRLDLNWREEPEALVIAWRESGGPTVKPPAAVGFGTRIITSSVERQLGGAAVFEWLEQGLSCTISVPLRDRPRVKPIVMSSSAQLPPRIITARSVMIVEDEALVAMVLEDQLQELGLSVLGTYGNVAEAVTAIEQNVPDAAILDVNVGGEVVYPLADMLLARGVPFVFVTGHARETIERRFSGIQVLEKPVERQALAAIFMPLRRLRQA